MSLFKLFIVCLLYGFADFSTNVSGKFKQELILVDI